MSLCSAAGLGHQDIVSHRKKANDFETVVDVLTVPSQRWTVILKDFCLIQRGGVGDKT